MAYALGLPDALRRRGLKVEVVPGWETRSAGSFNPKGAVAHWTASPRAATGRPSLNVVVNGRPDLDGPLCNVYGARDGTAVVVAAGRANHAGAGGWRGLTGNSSVFGTEMEGADATDFTEAQRWSYPRIHAAYCDLGGFGPDMNCGHSEWAGPRKTDINGYTPNTLRADIAAVLNGDDDMPNYLDWRQQDKEALVSDIWKGLGIHPRSGVAGDDGKETTPLDQLLDVAARASRLPSAADVINGLLDTPIDRTDVDRGPTTLRAILVWSDNHVDSLASAIAAAASAGPVDAAAVRQLVQDAVNSIDVKITAG